MDKRIFSPLELIKIATQHAYCAEHLLKDNAEVAGIGRGTSDALLPIASLMYTAFTLTLKAYLLRDYKKNNLPKSLMELVELNSELGLSNQDKQLLKNLSRQMAFRKGVDYDLWDDRQQFHVFCSEIVALYERLQELMPLELQDHYHK